MNTTKTILVTLMLALLGLSNAYSQVGIGTTSPHASAALDIESTTKGFLPPRTTPGAITNPAEGLVIYNEDINCLMVYQNPYWFDVCSGSTFGTIPGNTTCSTATISVTPCSAVPGATLNDDAGTADGIEYDWTEADSYMSGGTADALVEIGGQCWFARNSINPSTAPIADDPNTGSNIWGATSVNDEGYWGYYNTADNSSWGAAEPATGEGLLYQWSAAMNGSDTERAQGVCPTGWHVPSDCEWMYLENTLGMSTTDQEGTGFRNSGSVGSKLSTLTSSGTNSSGFTALLAGDRGTTGTFSGRGVRGSWCSSSETSATNAQSRGLFSTQAVVNRDSFNKAFGFSVRCLKD